jgi:hypothetical protein
MHVPCFHFFLRITQLNIITDQNYSLVELMLVHYHQQMVIRK